MDEEMNRWVEGYSRWKKHAVGDVGKLDFILVQKCFICCPQTPFQRPVWQEVTKADGTH